MIRILVHFRTLRINSHICRNFVMILLNSFLGICFNIIIILLTKIIVLFNIIRNLIIISRLNNFILLNIIGQTILISLFCLITPPFLGIFIVVPPDQRVRAITLIIVICWYISINILLIKIKNNRYLLKEKYLVLSISISNPSS